MALSKYSQYENLVAYDCSYSTSYSCSNFDTTLYHSKTQDLVKNLDSTNTLFIRWDQNHTVISKVDLEIINKQKKGFGGTSPVSLFKFIKEINFKGNLIFISDGQIGNECVETCSEILLSWKFNLVSIYLIYTGGTINESVSCALTRSSPHNIYIYKHGLLTQPAIKVTDNDYKFVYNIENINTIEEFLKQKEILKNVLVSINMGTNGNKVLHTKLVALKNKLTKYESKIFLKNIDNPVSRLIESFKKSEPSLSELDNVWKMYYKLEDIDEDNDWKKLIDKFISWCSGSLLTSFDRNKISNREKSSIIEPVIPSESVEIVEEKIEDLKLTCPITLSDSSNMILLMKKTDTSVFDDLPTYLRDSLINCPLNALRNNDILNYIKSLFDCVISIEAYKELVDYGISDKSPLTREQIFGGLCLGKDNSHIKATNSTIRYILTGGKSLGNMDLWFTVIYFIIKRGQAEHLLEYLPIVEEHLKFRLINNKSYMCLSGLPTYPTYSVPIGLALWCSIMATTSNLSLIKNPKNDPIRLHLSYSLDMIELLNIIGISVPSKLLEHINRLKTLRYFLLEVKKGKENSLKLKNLIDALSYNSIETSDLWILIDGEPSDSQISNVRLKLPSVCKELSNTEIKDILELCDSNKSESDIYIPYNYVVKSFEKTITKNWSIGNNIPSIKVNISPKTCRPYYNIIDNGRKKIWLDKATEIYGNELFSTSNFFGTYISENKKYPTKSEFLNYLFMYHFTRNKKTLPICIEKFVNEAFIDYEEILDNIDPLTFSERWLSSVYKDVRMQMEA
jgi:hypothetical protein